MNNKIYSKNETNALNERRYKLVGNKCINSYLLRMIAREYKNRIRF